MKLEKHFERLCSKAEYADDILLELLDFIMVNSKNYHMREHKLLKAILKKIS